MKSFWEKTKKTVKEKTSLVKGKVGMYSSYSKLTIHKHNLKKQAEKLSISLGEKVYTLFTEKKLDSLKDDEEALSYMLKIRGLENEIKEVEEKIKGLQDRKKKEGRASNTPTSPS